VTPTIAEIAAELARLRLDAENYARQAGEASLMYGVLFRRIARLEESLDVLRNEPDEIEAPPAPIMWYGDRHEGSFGPTSDCPPVPPVRD
jgi:hypothetical protein